MSKPGIDFDAVGGVDGRRLERSLGLVGKWVAPGQYRVSGGHEPHWVDLYTAQFPRCDCADHLWRDALCKHILAALLREGDERLIGELRDLVAELREQALPRAA